MHTKLAALRLVIRTESGLNKRVSVVMKFSQTQAQIRWTKFGPKKEFSCTETDCPGGISGGKEVLEDTYDDGRDISTRGRIIATICCANRNSHNI